MKVLFLIRSLDVGGAERQLVLLAKGIRDRGVDVGVAVFYGDGSLEIPLRAAGVRLHELNKKSRWDTIGFFLRLWRTVRREQPDVLHSYLPAANVVAALLRPFVPHLKIVWGVRASNMNLDRYDRLARAVFAASRWLAHRVDLIIANSHAGLDFHQQEGYPATRLRVVENGVDIEQFAPNPRARQQQRAAWNIRDEDCVVGLVARLDPMKDHEMFLRAAAQLVAVADSYRFVCIGGGPAPYARQLRHFAASLGLERKLIWAGEQTDVGRIYPAFDIAVSTSAFGEGFPNVIAEAMASGVPCVVTDVGDAGRIVGDTGLVVRARNSDALAWGIAEMRRRLTLDKPGIAYRTRERVVVEFGVEHMVSRTLVELRSLVANQEVAAA